MHSDLKTLALAALVLIGGNIVYSTTLQAEKAQPACYTGCDSQTCDGSCDYCFPNPFDSLPEPGICTD